MLNSKTQITIQEITKIALQYCVALLFFSIPFHRVSTSIPLVILTITTIFYLLFNRKELKQNTNQNSLLFFNSFYFLSVFIHFIIFYKSSSFNSLQILFLIVLIPLLLYHVNKTILEKSITVYIAACLSFTLIILINALSKFSSLGFDAFFYQDLLSDFKQNPIILSFFYNIAIICLIYKLPKEKSFKNIALFFLLYIVLAFSIILFGSKIGYIMLLINSIISFFLLPITFLKKIGILIITGVISFAIYLKVPYVNHEINGTIWQISKSKYIIDDHKLPRPIVWKTSKKIIEKNFYTGVGSGNSVEALKVEFEKIDYQKGIKGKFNAHNQFIETFLENGFFVFSFLIILIIFYFYSAIKSKSIYFLSFLILSIAYMLVESIFKSQASFVTFVLFLTCFYKLDVLKRTIDD